MEEILNVHTGMQSLSSVEFRTSVKGEVSWTVKVYNEDPDAAYQKAISLAGQAMNAPLMVSEDAKA